MVSLRSPGDQLSTSRPQQTKRLGRQVILAQPSASSRGSPSGGTTPHTVGVSCTRHNPGGLLQAAQPHILWGSPSGGTTPHTVVSLRSPGNQLSTSRPQQTKRLGRQVILAQPAVGGLLQVAQPHTLWGSPSGGTTPGVSFRRHNPTYCGGLLQAAQPHTLWSVSGPQETS